MDRLREQMVNFLSAHQVGLLSLAGPEGVWAMPVRYRNDQLQVECLLPRWADVVYYLKQDPRALLVVVDFPPPTSSPPPNSLPQNWGRAGVGAEWHRWLRYVGQAEFIPSSAWRDPALAVHPAHVAELYHVIRLTPWRIDLFDESKGWGARETLDM